MEFKLNGMGTMIWPKSMQFIDTLIAKQYTAVKWHSAVVIRK